MPAVRGQSARPHTYGPPVVVEVMVKVRALAFEEAEGGYSVAVPELPGCFTQGETIEEVQAMAGWHAYVLVSMSPGSSASWPGGMLVVLVSMGPSPRPVVPSMLTSEIMGSSRRPTAPHMLTRT